MNAPVHSATDRVHIRSPRLARWLDIGNALYTTSLRCLLQGFGASDRHAKAVWLQASFALMRATVPVGQGLAARPANDEPASPNGGLSFTPLRTLARLPDDGAAALVAERLGQLRQRAAELPLELVAGETAASWQAVIDLLAAQQRALMVLAGTAAAVAAGTAGTASAGGSAAAALELTVASAVSSAVEATPASSEGGAVTASNTTPPNPVEVARGQGATVFFEARRCIHSRHCVLDAPTVFKANTPGEWIYPDTVSVEALVAVAQICPSGAIRYERHDGGPEEAAPAVNQLRIRENGPYAVHAPILLAGRDDGFRATLCRCGQSKNKPWCDGSHVGAGFVASGEPASGAVDPLSVRNGPIAVTPLRNGPLQVRGNLEICAGTGRTVARITEARLCRCGQSKNKPFCDGSHIVAGFVAEGN
jgi:CDGSH-type Zn-finger protein/uncharacterized Fe-S cluster protein YjdI